METDVRTLARADDRDLLTALRGGEADAFAILYDRHHELVFRVANRILADADSAEDIVQSIFISIWQAPPAFGAGPFESWLRRVARNRVLDALRTRSARRESDWPEHLSSADSVDELVAMRLENHRVRVAIATLPPAQRHLIELGFFGEHSHAELAELTSLPLGTVKTRIRSGLQKLRYSLAPPDVVYATESAR